MTEIEIYGNYQKFKESLDMEMREASERFVRIGWLLRQALETDILKESGYANVNDFAQKEYGLDKTQVSRFININIRFSEGGNSPMLKEQYRGTGYAKLALMLSLPEEINEEISEGYSKSEIQAVKEEVEQENRITDLEVLMEGQNPEQEAMETNLDRVIHQLGEDRPELYKQLHERRTEGLEAVKEILAPDGEKIYFVRIRGIGRKMLSLKTAENTVTVIDVRSQEKERYSWEQVRESIERILKPELAAGESWESVYGKGFPKKPEVAPVQPQKEQASRKEKKVQKAREPEKPKERKHEPEKTKEKSSGTAASEPERKDNHREPGTEPDTGYAGGICQEERNLPEEPGTGRGQQDGEISSGAGYRTDQPGICSEESGEPEESGSTEDDGEVSQEVILVNDAAQWLEAARDILLAWRNAEIPLEELQAAKRKAERFMSILDDLIRMKSEDKQLDGQMSIEDVMNDKE